MGLTRERIRQIESKAMRHLKHPGRIDALLTALDKPNPPIHTKGDEVDNQSAESDYEAQRQELGNAVTAKQPRNDLRKPPSIPVDVTSPVQDGLDQSARALGMSNAVQSLLLEVSLLGAVVKIDQQQGTHPSVWIDFNNTGAIPPRPMIRKLIASGFKFSPGKGYGR